MADHGKFTKITRQTELVSGLVTIFPMITKAAGNPPFGLGVSEHKPGVVDLNLNYDEAIYLLDGDLEIASGEERYQLAPGECLWMPRGAKISYVVRQSCRYLYVTSPASPNR
jgi:ethanolamine utilization protein EutQ (cupin superfamily)